MPQFVVAHKSGAHRLAATALYRALISQCKKLDASAACGLQAHHHHHHHHQQQLHNLIRCRFSAFRHTTSHRELKLLFEAGYEAVDHLDAAVAGEPKSTQYVLDLLKRAPPQAKESQTKAVQRRSLSEQYNDPFRNDSPAPSMPQQPVVLGDASSTSVEPPKPASAARSDRREVALQDGGKPASESLQDPTAATTVPARKSIFERALAREELGGTGRRQVPKIFSANSIPVLRFVGSQSPALTGILNFRIKQRQRRHDLRHALEDQIPIAEQEDQWDAILNEHAGIRGDRESQTGSRTAIHEARWDAEVREALKQVNSYLDQEKVKNRAMAEKMYAVIDREALLVEQERLEDEKEKSGSKEEPEGLSDMVSDIIGATDAHRRSNG
ncbi:Putative complex 1 LYR protein [Septoria linicola]|uniref:Complex 1 LYR protein n=1 Tax=Septoria linicola TaxID=215465 RepID=A0A9Q9AJC3_9PEZI|nr:putative complex 1 LYR protein [Septoria linicola]USW47157.1 Putative complex 1 LYR protein [Septoria linicola]